jgi:hypothetical protein
MSVCEVAAVPKTITSRTPSKTNQSTSPVNFLLRGALSQVKAAAALGIADNTLCKRRATHRIWAPAVCEPRHCLYPLRQIELLTAVSLGLITPDAALAQWDAELGNLAMSAKGNA